MRISEISSPAVPHTIRQTATDHHRDPDHKNLHHDILSKIEDAVKKLELHSHDKPLLDIIFIDLRQCLAQISQLSPIANAFKLNIWKLGYRIWNACVDISNTISLRSSTCPISTDDQAKLRHIAADLLFVACDVIGVPSPAVKSALFYYKTGLVYHDLKKFDLASVCFERATDLLSKTETCWRENSGERKLVLDVNLARSRTAWEVSDRNLAVALLNRSKGLISDSAGNRKVLAEQYLAFGKLMLSKNGGEAQQLNEALKLMNEALDVCEKGLSTARTQEETVELRGLRIKALRFISAVHLQKEEFESAIKCVKVLRESDGGDNHPSLSVLAMKASLGLGRYGEAEKELRGMVVNKGIPENVWVSAVEAYFMAAGTAGAETAKGVFLGLLGRCHVSAGAAVRVAHRVVSKGGEGLKVRAKVVAELVSDERIVALFVGEAADKERSAMHAVLWNCAADLFQSKDYETSEELFEKSMLYIPSNVENRTLRAKGFRVLCLCHLGLSQLDRAMEYINEAEKLDPNIVCAFLKFKILLQNKDQNGAVAQIEAMPSCLDFTPDFLSLSAHEAIACRALTVAVASLSNLLNFFAAGKSMPTSEVVVLRTLVTVLIHEPGNERQALKFLGHTYNRAIEVGPEIFFGKEEIGRRERNWFAVTSWNFGVRIGKEKNFEESAAFLKLASEFYVFVEGPDTENRIMVCKSLVFSVSATIASEHQKNAALSETEVKQAIELLDKAGKILRAASSGTCDGRLFTFEPDLFFMYTYCACDLQGRLNDLKSQLLTVKNFASTKACKAQHLLQLGLCASQGPRSNHEVATFCLNACLPSFISSPSTDYRNVALIMRKLISLASIHRGDTDDNAVYDMYKQAYRIMVGLKDGEYPAEEGKWLATTAWNRAAVPVRAAQIEVAKKWMALGIEVAKHVTGMETYKACMDDFLDGFEKKLQCA